MTCEGCRERRIWLHQKQAELVRNVRNFVPVLRKPVDPNAKVKSNEGSEHLTKLARKILKQRYS